MPVLNYSKNIDEIKKLLDCWSWRFLSVIGKMQVKKALAIPKLVHLFLSLPTPDDCLSKEIESILYNFIWNGKREKVARKTLINTIENGGLKMIDIVSFAKALKISWVKNM